MAADSGASAGNDASGQPIGAGAKSQPPTTHRHARSARRPSISIDFSVPMDRADVEERFAIPRRSRGSLSWNRGSLVFTPRERLHPGTRYTISVIGSHDRTATRWAARATSRSSCSPAPS